MQSKPNNHYLDGIKNRDRKIVEDIYSQFLPSTISFVMKNGGNREDARDVFNLVIYQLTARLEREDILIKSTFEGYLFTACKNMWRRQLKKIERQRVTEGTVRELYYREQDMVQSTLEQDKWNLFQEKLDAISENCRVILQMFFKKISSREIMEALDYASETTVRQRIFKCKTQLTKLVQSDSRYKELKNL
jgi:RNA polymerase sigma factor (sigma-70 family)